MRLIKQLAAGLVLGLAIGCLSNANAYSGDPPAPKPEPAAISKAEYAVRWNVGKGPKDAAAVAAALGLEPCADAPDCTTHYDVGYMQFDAPADAPKDMTPILRQRTVVKDSGKPGKTQIMLKYRGDAAFPAPSLSSWACPLGGNDKKDEVDVSFGPGDATKRAYSRSCSVKDKDAQPPPAFNAKPPACMTRVHRREGTLSGHEVKIEEWLFKDGAMLEVSMPGLDNAQDAAAFRELVLQKLKGTDWVLTGKTQLAGKCP